MESVRLVVASGRLVEPAGGNRTSEGCDVLARKIRLMRSACGRLASEARFYTIHYFHAPAPEVVH